MTTPETAVAPLAFPAGTAEATLLDQLKAPSTNPKWIDLDVRFDTGEATLQPGASAQLADIAKALAAYPDARVRIAGYADATGTPDVNRSVSQARADAVRQELIARGVEGSRIEAKGYPQAAPEEPGAPVQANRRVAIQVVAP
jgi:OmpA-OmpF porin, OOP family